MAGTDGYTKRMKIFGLLFAAVLATAGCSGTGSAAAVDPLAERINSGPCVAPVGMRSQVDQTSDGHQLPWRRDDAEKVAIYFAVAGLSAEWREYLEYGSDQWNQSPCLDTHVVDACPPGSNCVTVSVKNEGDDGNFNSVENGGFTTGGHIDLKDSLSAGAKKNVAVHEMGHAVGLQHRKMEHVLMNAETYDDVFDPDAIDYLNLLFAYGRQLPRG